MEPSGRPGAPFKVSHATVAIDNRALHIWRHDLDRGPADTSILDETERRRASAFFRSSDRTRFIAGRCFLRSVLARYLGQAPERIALVLGTHGKPALAGTSSPSFNLSHSGGIAYLALTAEGPVGIDVELDQELDDVGSLAETVFSPSEIAAVARSTGRGASAMFLRAWTRKEALVKAIGIGILTDLKAITVGAETADVVVRCPPGVDLIVRTIECRPGEHVAVAFANAPHDTRFYVLS